MTEAVRKSRLRRTEKQHRLDGTRSARQDRESKRPETVWVDVVRAERLSRESSYKREEPGLWGAGCTVCVLSPLFYFFPPWWISQSQEKECL